MKKTLGLIVLIGLLISCKDKWFNVLPKGQAAIETFSSKVGVSELLIGAYSVVDGTINTSTAAQSSSVSNWMWGSVAGGDAYKGSEFSDRSGFNQVMGFYADANNSEVANRWQPYYDGIVRTNDVLVAIPKAIDMTDQEKILAEAEAKFLRAHFYFELTIVFGPVPYIDEKTKNPTEVANDHLLWPEIEADMQFAVDNLPGRWTDKGRATKWAAKTYLARIYMFQHKFDLAKPLLQDVKDNGGFTLMPSYDMNYDLAYDNNAESIFEIQYAINDGASSGYNAGAGDRGNFPYSGPMATCCGFFQPSHALVSAHRVDATTGLPLLDDTYSVDDILPYSPTGLNVPYTGPVDPRLDVSVGRPGIPYLDWGICKGVLWIRSADNGGPYNGKKTMFKKSQAAFRSSTGAHGLSTNNFRKYKLDHVILWLAECEAEVGSLHNATLLVNMIRNRAKQSNVVKLPDGTPAANYKVEPYPVDFPTKAYALKAIRYEDRIEFAMEGLRFFDLVRWGIAAQEINSYLSVEGTVMSALTGKSFSAGQHEIWPIPQKQIDLSQKDGKSVLIQNPGY